MQAGRLWRVCRVCRRNVIPPRRLLSSQSHSQHAKLSKTRNIGIIAHIDAGKTTTTERMLYYSGYTRRIGDVDEGSTVTDFLPAERARGITIQSAAITFYWPPPDTQTPQLPVQELPETFDHVPRSSISHTVNLIDTPGHADFTFEVLRSLRVLDGAVCILDGVAGVEAQTEKVWSQAGVYNIPRIVFVNKLDRDGAGFSRTVKEIGARLAGWPAVCHIPWWKGGTGAFIGVGDVIHLRGLLWSGAQDGSQIRLFNLEELEATDKRFGAEIIKARIALVELLSEHDHAMVELFLEHEENHLAIPGALVLQSLRRVLLNPPQTIIPVFAGASFCNIGVQPLLDSVVDLLPSPLERPNPTVSLEKVTGTLSDLLSGSNMLKENSTAIAKRKHVKVPEVRNLQACALAFKVVNDAKRGVLVYVRCYHGSIDRGSILYNTNLSVGERAPRLLQMYANDAVEILSIPSGQIGVIAGLKYARTGDTLIMYKGLAAKAHPPAPLKSLQLAPIHVPPPVFFTSIEPNSLSEQKHVMESLDILLREDPSLHLSVDEESGQTHLAGMGDLHLEIARDRLLNDLKAKARIGKIEIGYRETLNVATSPYTHHLERTIAGKLAKASITAAVTPVGDTFPISTPSNIEQDEYAGDLSTTYTLDSGNTLTISHPTVSLDSKFCPTTLPPTLPLPTILSSIHAGCSAALARGPLAAFPLASTHISIAFDASTSLYPETTPTAISMAARSAVVSSLRNSCEAAPSTLMEPVMLVTIFVQESAIGSVVQDLSSARGGQVISLDSTAASSSPAAVSEDLQHIDVSQIYVPPDPFSNSAADVGGAVSDPQRQIVARVPLKEMVGYLNYLRALTGGRGTFVMTVDGFERMGTQRQKDVLDAMREFG